MNRKKNLLQILSKSDSEKRDTSLRRSDVQTPARVSSQPSQTVSSQSSQGMSQFPWVVAPQPSRRTSQPFWVTSSQQPARVTMAQQPFQTTSQFSRVSAPQTSQLVASQFSRVEVSQPSRGMSQRVRVMAPQRSQGSSELSRGAAPQPSRRISQPSRLSASTAPAPAPPVPTPSPPAQPCCRRLTNLLSQGPRLLQQRCALVWERISSPEKHPFHLPRAKLPAESAGGAEGSCGTTMPLPPIQPPAAASSGPNTTRVQPNKQVAAKKPAPPPRERNPQGAPQVGTGPLPSSRLCPSQQPQQQQQHLQPQPPQQPRGSSLTHTRRRSVRNPGAVARPEPEAEVAATMYTINLSAEATRLLMRRQLENQWEWMNPFGSTGVLLGSQSRAGLDLANLIKISLPNEHNQYDDEVYEKDPVPGVRNRELVHRCTKWLRGVEEAKREGKLETPPYLDDP